MNDRPNDALGRSIRNALGDIVAGAPTPSELPTRSLDLRRLDARSRGPRSLVVATVGLAAAAGIAGAVVVARRPEHRKVTAAADPSGATSDTTGATLPGSTVQDTPTTSNFTPDSVRAPMMSDLLYPGNALTAKAELQEFNPAVFATTYISPTKQVLGVAVLPKVSGLPNDAQQRKVGTDMFTLLNEENQHVYLTSNECRTVSVLIGHEEGPWATETLSFLEHVHVGTSSDSWSIDDMTGWTQVDNGFGGGAGRIFDLTYSYSEAGTDHSARLRQAEAPLGFLIAESGIDFASAEETTVNGLHAYALVDVVGRRYVGWNWSDTRASALLMVENADAGVLAKAVGALVLDRAQSWAKVLPTNSSQTAITTVGRTDTATASPQGCVIGQEGGVVPTTAVVTTVQVP